MLSVFIPKDKEVSLDPAVSKYKPTEVLSSKSIFQYVLYIWRCSICYPVAARPVPLDL